MQPTLGVAGTTLATLFWKWRPDWNATGEGIPFLDLTTFPKKPGQSRGFRREYDAAISLVNVAAVFGHVPL